MDNGNGYGYVLSSLFYNSIVLWCFCQGEPLPGMPGSQVGPVPIICMYGVTTDGNSVTAYVHGFSPYFYVPAGQGFQADDCSAFRVNNLLDGIISFVR